MKKKSLPAGNHVGVDREGEFWGDLHFLVLSYCLLYYLQLLLQLLLLFEISYLSRKEKLVGKKTENKDRNRKICGITYSTIKVRHLTFTFCKQQNRQRTRTLGIVMFLLFHTISSLYYFGLDSIGINFFFNPSPRAHNIGESVELSLHSRLWSEPSVFVVICNLC